ncbi:hypothetical protein V1477_001526 [Vespula maculifrons]|uniref:Uncharacterized protein n=1 Tax=Vespula maculifrons TaxID=7453 RepID=A0ABD2D003_VESMC
MHLFSTIENVLNKFNILDIVFDAVLPYTLLEADIPYIHDEKRRTYNSRNH